MICTVYYTLRINSPIKTPSETVQQNSWRRVENKSFDCISLMWKLHRAYLVDRPSRYFAECLHFAYLDVVLIFCFVLFLKINYHFNLYFVYPNYITDSNECRNLQQKPLLKPLNQISCETRFALASSCKDRFLFTGLYKAHFPLPELVRSSLCPH